MLKKINCFFFLLLSTFIFAQAPVVSGELRQFHKVTLEYTSAASYNESNGDALYFDIRLDVTFTSPTGKVDVVPGYFAADGNAANSGATSGNKWHVNFTPKEIGEYDFTTSFRTGSDVAINSSPTAGITFDFHGEAGSFTIAPTNKAGVDFRGKGVLEYVGEHFMQWTNGEYFLEVGADSPEVFLEYNDFDNTPNSSGRTYATHVSDWNTGDPLWKSTEGKGIIGVVNYLSQSGMNVNYFLTMNSFGDGENAYPWTGNNTTNQYDVSKLAQWEIVFDHMMKMGVMPEFVLSEQENQSLFEANDGLPNTGFANARKLYYREMVARFGYLNATVWNIGEEANWQSSGANGRALTPAQILTFASYLDNLLWDNELVVSHNGPSTDDSIFGDLLGDGNYKGISFQGNYANITHGHDAILGWIEDSATNGVPWVVRYSEPFVSATTTQDTWRKNSLWASLTAGAAGIQYYDGGGRDLTTQDYNTLAPYFSAMKYAKDFFEDNNIPFNEMSNNDAGTSNGWMLSKTNQVAVVYLPDGGSSNVNAGTSGTFTVKWYDPRNGGSLQNGSVTSITADGSAKSIGNAPNNTTSDWVVLLENGSAPTGAAISINNTTVVEGTNAVLTVTLDNVISGGFTVDFATQNNSATAGTDFTTNTGSLTFAGTAGETQTITIVTTDDATSESSEQFFVNLTNATNGVTISENQGVVTLTDNDGTTGCTADYNEVGGTVVIEAENLTLNTGWSVGTTKTGYTGTGYITYTGTPSFATPGNNPITATIQINTPGTYLFEWRNVIGTTGSTTDDNDTWVRFNDASEFYATSGTNTIYPQGSGQTPNVNGAGGGNWFKVYSNSASWNWQTRTNDNNPYTIYVDFDIAGVYSMEISSRSENHFIDRITLSNAGGNQDLGLTQTLCDSSPISVTGVDVSPATGNIAIGNTIQLTRTITPSNATEQTGIWSSNATGVATVSSNGLVTGVSEGSTTITYTTNDGSFTDTATITVSLPSSSISINNTTVIEGNNAVFTVALDNAVSGGFTVDFATQDDSATAGTDYTANNSTLTFAGTAGETQTITIVTTDDATSESSEQFFVNLTNATNGVTISDNQGVVTLTDNDGTTGCTADYNELGGTVVIEAENLNLPAGWNVENATTGFTGTGYINWTGGEFFNAQGNGTISSTIQINTPGTYLFEWRNKIGAGTSNTDNNDTWVRFNDASDFYAVSGSTTIYPQGSGQIPTVNGAGGDNWFKVYSNSSSWNWQTRTNDNNPYAIYVDFDTPGVYTMEISGRSENHFIDRITLSSAGGNQDLGLNQTLCDSSPIAVTGVNISPATGNIAIGNTIQLTRTITPSNATDQTGFWSSDNTGVGTVNSSGLVTGVSEGSVTITYTTNDGSFTDTATITVSLPSSSISINNTTVIEGNNAVFTVTLDNAVSGGFTVDFATQNNSAIGGTDYSTSNGTLTFAGTAGETQTMNIVTIDDTIIEASERFYVNLSNATNGVTISDSRGIATITDNDDFEANITVNDITVGEGDDAVFTVTLDNDVSGGFTIDYTTSDDTAFSSTDYIATNNTLTFNGTAGETQTITISTIDDATIETNERFFIDLSNASNSVTIIDNQGVATITDNDALANISINNVTLIEGVNAVFTVTVDNAVTGGFTVEFTTQDNSATAGDDYTMSTGSLTFAGTQGETQTITITTTDDTIVEANERFYINLSNATNAVIIADNQGIATITDNDGFDANITINDISVNEGDDAILTVTLDNAVSGGFTLNYATQNNSATAVGDSDFTAANGLLTFSGTAGETQTITITTTDDSIIEANERFFVNLSNATNGVTISDSRGIATITDNDDFEANITVNDITVGEGDDAVFTVTLDNDVTGGFTIDYTTSDDTAMAGIDYVATNNTIAFNGTAGETKTITIITTDDASVEANEQFFVNLSNATNGVTIADSQGIATITDNDNPNTPISVQINDAVALEGEELIFTISLSIESTEDIALTFSFLNETASDLDYETAPIQLIFEVGETIKEIRIPLFEDNETELDETFLVQISSVDQGEIVNQEVTAIGTILDNTEVSVVLYPVPLQSGGTLNLEGLANGSYILSLFTMSNKRLTAELIEVTNNSYSIDTVETLSSGVYLMNLDHINSGKNIKKRFVINK